MSEKSEDTAQQSCKMLQKFASRGTKCPPKIQMSVNFASLQSDTFVSFQLFWRNKVFQSY